MPAWTLLDGADPESSPGEIASTTRAKDVWGDDDSPHSGQRLDLPTRCIRKGGDD